MTYEQALDFWFGRINYERAAARPADFKLERMRAILGALGNPQEKFAIIHVAGSKGKGSTSAMLASILQEAGYRTGLFTSPHLTSVLERMQVDGQPIGRDELARLLSEIAALTGERHGESAVLPSQTVDAPTFFEIATALGFLFFARREVDVAVVEVGLGGRFDSTNVCHPLVAIITSISFDHTEILGNSLASITAEKAGIIKPGRPTVSGARAPDARAVIEATCRERRARLRQLDVDFQYHYEPAKVWNLPHTADPDLEAKTWLQAPRLTVRTDRHDWPQMQLGLLGEHQAANAAVAVACVEELNEAGLRIDERAVAAGLATVRWPARLEVLDRRPLVILDCAHNVASAQALVDTLLSSFAPARRLLVFAGSTDKDLRGMLRLLSPHFEHIYFTRYTSNPRSLPPDQLCTLLEPRPGQVSSIHALPADAWLAAHSEARPEDLICVTGSVYLAGELRPLMLPKSQEMPLKAGGLLR